MFGNMIASVISFQTQTCQIFSNQLFLDALLTLTTDDMTSSQDVVLFL